MTPEIKLLISEEELPTYLAVSATFDYQKFKKHLEITQNNVIKKLIGNEQLDELLQNLSTNSTTEIENWLIHKLRYPLVNYAFVAFMPSLMLNIDSSGIRIQSNENYKTAFQWQTDSLEVSVKREADSTLEDVLEFLDENIVQFQLYKNSDAYLNNKKYFINTVREFNQFRNIRNLRTLFLDMQYIMNDCEQITIQELIGIELYTELKKSIRKENITANPNYEFILKLIKYCVANFTFHRAVSDLNLIIDEKGFLSYDSSTTLTKNLYSTATNIQKNNIAESAKLMGEKYYKKLKDYLFAHADEIPIYKNSNAYKPNGFVALKNKDDWKFHAAM